MKKFLSILLAGIMLACMIPTVAFAEDGESQLPDGIYVGNTSYTSIDAAAAAAYNTDDKEITISGTVAVNGRQTIAYEGVKLVGTNNATLIPSANYANGSETNRKALFTITASNVQVTNVTFDGSVYGDTQPSTTDFVVVRINSGTGIVLDGVTITGSNRTLMTVGTSSTSASVTANGTSGLICNANYGQVPVHSLLINTNTYAAVNVVNGDFYLDKGAINGFIAEDKKLGQYAGHLHNSTTNNFTLTYPITPITNVKLTSTVEYFVGAYMVCRVESSTWADEYIDAVNNNIIIIGDMVDYAVVHSTSEVKANFVIALTDAKAVASSANQTTLQSYIDRLNGQGGSN